MPGHYKKSKPKSKYRLKNQDTGPDFGNGNGDKARKEGAMKATIKTLYPKYGTLGQGPIKPKSGTIPTEER